MEDLNNLNNSIIELYREIAQHNLQERQISYNASVCQLEERVKAYYPKLKVNYYPYCVSNYLNRLATLYIVLKNVPY